MPRWWRRLKRWWNGAIPAKRPMYVSYSVNEVPPTEHRSPQPAPSYVKGATSPIVCNCGKVTKDFWEFLDGSKACLSCVR